MGNHEYCMDCGENDFHLHRPCRPEKLAEQKRKRQERTGYYGPEYVNGHKVCEACANWPASPVCKGCGGVLLLRRP